MILQRTHMRWFRVTSVTIKVIRHPDRVDVRRKVVISSDLTLTNKLHRWAGDAQMGLRITKNTGLCSK